jgi:D-sedoheptulose 7-phosphate isomerase
MSSESEVINAYLDDASSLMLQSKILTKALDIAADLIAETLHKGGKILLCGNGGSAADAQHIAAEFVGQYKTSRGPLAAIALTTDTSALTAIGNDFGFNYIFARQIQALAKEGDVLICYSTSGASQNVISAIEVARGMNLGIVVFSSIKAPTLEKLIDLRIPSLSTPQIQQVHLTLSHVLCEVVEIKLNRIKDMRA